MEKFVLFFIKYYALVLLSTSVKTAEEMAKTILKEDGIEESCSLELFNANNLTVTPAFIDMHVHLRYPGQIQKEDLSSGLKAAAAGGFGTVVAMPNTNPVVSSVEMAMQIEKEAAALGLTQLFQTVSLTKDFAGSDTSHLDFLDKKYIPVISEDGRDVASSSVMLEAMKKASEKGVVVSCHCEDPFLTVDAKSYRQVALNSIQKVGLNTWGTLSEFDFADNRPEDYDIIDEALCQADLLLEKAEDLMTIRNLELAKMADVIIANEEDIQSCLGISLRNFNTTTESYRDLCQQVKKQYPNVKIVAVTLRHSYSADKNGWSTVMLGTEKFYESTRYEIENIVERVGAGDSFAAGLIYGLTEFNDEQKL